MLKEISPYDLKFNPAAVFAGSWMLITAGNEKDGYNTLTASWGQIGSLWSSTGAQNTSPGGLPVATIFVRPQRYTKEFLDKESYYTIGIYDNQYKKALSYLGARSGREEDKVAKAGLKPVFIDDTTYIDGAELVLICRKLYQAPILESGFVDQEVMEKTFPQKDYQEMYIGQIEKVLISEEAYEKYAK